jgi:acyl-CoA thioesterase YciA
MNLFAYGTLMTADGLVKLLGDRARGFRYRVARLHGWRRVWNTYREEWQGGVLNAVRAEGVIVGVLVAGLTPEDLSQLDSQESTHLPRQVVLVHPEGADPVSAEIYVCPRGDYEGPPSPPYLAAVLERARQAGKAVLESLAVSCPSMSDERIPAIKVLLLPKDTNALGTIFGGVILSHIDLASAVEARKVAAHRYVTKAMREVEFHEPVFLGDIVNFFTETARVGRTSVTVKVTVEAERWGSGRGERVKVTEAEVVLVAVDESGHPTPVRGE